MSNWLEPVELSGAHVRLEPLSMDHHDALAAAAADGRRRPSGSLPPGRVGLTPKLALAYSSGNSNGCSGTDIDTKYRAYLHASVRNVRWLDR